VARRIHIVIAGLDLAIHHMTRAHLFDGCGSSLRMTRQFECICIKITGADPIDQQNALCRAASGLHA